MKKILALMTIVLAFSGCETEYPSTNIVSTDIANF